VPTRRAGGRSELLCLHQGGLVQDVQARGRRRHDLQRLAGEVSYRRYPPPFDKTDLILLVLLILLGVIAALRIFR